MLTEPNKVVIEAMKDFACDRPIKTISRETGLSRITLNAWRLGGQPQLGTLLEHFFVGTAAAKELAYILLFRLYPEVAKRLPIAE